MPTDDDKKSAWSRFDGEAKRILVRRPRLGRDRALFGRRQAAQTVTLTAAELRALFEGRTLAADVGGKSRLYIAVDEETRDRFIAEGRADGAVKSPRFSERVRVRAAQVRVAADRRARVTTPSWIVELAKREPHTRQ